MIKFQRMPREFLMNKIANEGNKMDSVEINFQVWEKSIIVVISICIGCYSLKLAVAFLKISAWSEFKRLDEVILPIIR